MTGPFAAMTAVRPFDATDRAILEFERLRFRTIGAKHDEIQQRFALTPVTYFVRLNWILDQPEAVAYDAVLVSRLVRLRDRRKAVRTHGTDAAGVDTRSDARGIRPALLGGVL